MLGTAGRALVARLQPSAVSALKPVSRSFFSRSAAMLGTNKNPLMLSSPAPAKILREGEKFDWAPTNFLYKSREQMVAEEIIKGTNATSPAPLSSIKKDGFIFEFSVTWVISIYRNFFTGFARNLFATTRPLLLLLIMGNVFKGFFFILGAPMLLSFYSAWFFEVFYGLFQCTMSFLFVSFYYNGMSFIGPGAPRTCGMYRSPQWVYAWVLAWCGLAACTATEGTEARNVFGIGLISVILGLHWMQ